MTVGNRRDGDSEAGIEVLDDFERFSQVDDVFSRSFWDEAIRDDTTDRFYATYRRPLTRWRKANGFTQHDYAVRNAAWHVSDVFAEMYEDQGRRDGFLDPLSMLRDGAETKLAPESPDESARQSSTWPRSSGPTWSGSPPSTSAGSTPSGSAPPPVARSRTTCPTG